MYECVASLDGHPKAEKATKQEVNKRLTQTSTTNYVRNCGNIYEKLVQNQFIVKIRNQLSDFLEGSGYPNGRSSLAREHWNLPLSFFAAIVSKTGAKWLLIILQAS